MRRMRRLRPFGCGRGAVASGAAPAGRLVVVPAPTGTGGPRGHRRAGQAAARHRRARGGGRRGGRHRPRRGAGAVTAAGAAAVVGQQARLAGVACALGGRDRADRAASRRADGLGVGDGRLVEGGVVGGVLRRGHRSPAGGQGTVGGGRRGWASGAAVSSVAWTGGTLRRTGRSGWWAGWALRGARWAGRDTSRVSARPSPRAGGPGGVAPGLARSAPGGRAPPRSVRRSSSTDRLPVPGGSLRTVRARRSGGAGGPLPTRRRFPRRMTVRGGSTGTTGRPPRRAR